jgi:hypothetical protein
MLGPVIKYIREKQDKYLEIHLIPALPQEWKKKITLIKRQTEKLIKKLLLFLGLNKQIKCCEIKIR